MKISRIGIAAVLSASMIFGFASCDTSTSSSGGEPDTPETPAINLSSITITGTPASALYYVGDSLDTTGLTVTATYSDGSSKAVTGFSVAAFSEVNLGTEQTLTISYTEGSVTKTADVSGTFYVAATGAKPTESPAPPLQTTQALLKTEPTTFSETFRRQFPPFQGIMPTQASQFTTATTWEATATSMQNALKTLTLTTTPTVTAQQLHRPATTVQNTLRLNRLSGAC